MPSGTRRRSAGMRGRVSALAGVLSCTLMVAMTLGAAGGTSVAGAQGVAGATIVICKAGNVTGSFQFSLNSASPISIAVGACDSLPVEDGDNTVTELVDQSGQTTLSTIVISPVEDTVSNSVPKRTAEVNIPVNDTATLTFTNVEVPKLQVCKVAGTASLEGQTFDFTQTGNSTTVGPYGVVAGTASAPGCGTAMPYPAGTAVNIAEAATAGDQVSNIAVTNGTLSNQDNSAGTVTATVASTGTTVVTYTNIQEPQLEVCKVAGTTSLQGKTFYFTQTGSGPTVGPYGVTAGTAASPGCGSPTSYPAGSAVNIAETATTGDSVSGIAVTNGTLSNQDDSAGTVTATLATTGTTVVTYTNVAEPQLEVCKVAGTPALVGKTFDFTQTGSGPTVGPYGVVAGTAAAPGCGSPTVYASGAVVNIAETATAGDQVSGIAVTNGTLSNQDDSAGTVTATLSTTGLTVVTYTNVETPPELEVCKVAGTASLNGKTFDFTQTGSGPTVGPYGVVAGTAAAPGCGSPTSYPAGSAVNIAETATAGDSVSGIAVTNGTLSNQDDSAGTVTATLATTGLTVVTYTNVAEPQLEVCKVAGTASLNGKTFDFTQTGSGPTVGPYGVVAGTAAAPGCSSPTIYAAGAAVNIAETATPGDSVSGIAVTNGTLSNQDDSAGTVTATLATTGLTVVTYTNVAEPQLEVCKVAGSTSLVGKTFDFTQTGSGPTVGPYGVVAGTAAAPGCGSPTPYPAGSAVNIAETATLGDQVSGIAVTNGTLSNKDNSAGTVTATVAATGTTVVTYTNKTVPEGRIKVCKTLTPGSGALVGTTFTFDVSDAAGAQTVSVIAPAVGTTACTRDNVFLPIGSVATVTEVAQPDVALVNLTVTPASANDGSTSTTAVMKVGSSVAAATFTNEALGWVEVCKDALNAQGLSWNFTVNGGTSFPVAVGGCSAPIQVPAGTATIQELETNPNYELQSVTAESLGVDSLLSGPTANGTVTVSVPFGGVAGETIATFTNAVKTGQFKICTAQTSPGAALAGQLFTYDYTYTVNGMTTSSSVTLTELSAGSVCSGLIGPVSIVNTDGSAVTVSVTAIAPSVSDVDLTSIVYQGGSSTVSIPPTPATFPATMTFSMGAGANVVTFTNGRTSG